MYLCLFTAYFRYSIRSKCLVFGWTAWRLNVTVNTMHVFYFKISLSMWSLYDSAKNTKKTDENHHYLTRIHIWVWKLFLFTIEIHLIWRDLLQQEEDFFSFFLEVQNLWRNIEKHRTEYKITTWFWHWKWFVLDVSVFGCIINWNCVCCS